MIRDVVNTDVPGVGRGIVDYTIKKLGINTESPTDDEVKKCIIEIVKHIKTLYGTDKANSLMKDLATFLPGAGSDYKSFLSE